VKGSLPVLPPRQILRALQRVGFNIARSSGSHVILKHPQKLNLRVTLSMHNRDVKRRTVESIITQSEMTLEEFIDLL
jgi:predicted RNA binding protein YcfA (HicA-like mRNA interferase family)